jgi:hypothetical protein
MVNGIIFFNSGVINLSVVGELAKPPGPFNILSAEIKGQQ